jgi:hypothetical protein
VEIDDVMAREPGLRLWSGFVLGRNGRKGGSLLDSENPLQSSFCLHPEHSLFGLDDSVIFTSIHLTCAMDEHGC